MGETEIIEYFCARLIVTSCARLGVFTTGKGIPGLSTSELPKFTQSVGPNQVILQMKCASLNHRDFFTIMAAEGYVPCSDGVGIVIEAGSRVSRVNVGDRVCPVFTQNWIESRERPTSAWALGTPKLPGLVAFDLFSSLSHSFSFSRHAVSANDAF